MSNFMTGGMGTFRAQVSAAETALPIKNAKVTIYDTLMSSVIYEDYTDENGILDGLQLACPPECLSLNENNILQPYATYNLKIESDGYVTDLINNFQVFDKQKALAISYLMPQITKETSTISETQSKVNIINTPTHALFKGQDGLPPPPNMQFLGHQKL